MKNTRLIFAIFSAFIVQFTFVSNCVAALSSEPPNYCEEDTNFQDDNCIPMPVVQAVPPGSTTDMFTELNMLPYSYNDVAALEWQPDSYPEGSSSPLPEEPETTEVSVDELKEALEDAKTSKDVLEASIAALEDLGDLTPEQAQALGVLKDAVAKLSAFITVVETAITSGGMIIDGNTSGAIIEILAVGAAVIVGIGVASASAGLGAIATLVATTMAMAATEKIVRETLSYVVAEIAQAAAEVNRTYESITVRQWFEGYTGIRLDDEPCFIACYHEP